MNHEPDFTFNGGEQNIGAIGRYARGSVHRSGGPTDPRMADLDRRLADLRALIEKHATALADAPGAREAADAVSEELRSDHPQPSRLRLYLTAIAGAAPGVTAVTQVVQELLRLVARTPA